MLNCLCPPSESEIISRELDKKSQTIFKEFHEALKILLLGPGESGKTTIIKQMKILHDNGFSEKEIREKAIEIRTNVHESMIEMLVQMDRLDIRFGSTYVVHIARRMLELERGLAPAPSKRYVDDMIALWNDEGIQQCFSRSNEFQLNDNSKYYLDQINVILHPDYVPSDEDILHSRKITLGTYEIKFDVRKDNKFGGGTHEIRMFDVGGQRDQRSKWIQVFEGIQAILFMMSCGDFDQKLREDASVNRLTESVNLFTDVWHNRYLYTAGVIVFLNKQDIMEEKVHSGKSIGTYFPEYNSYVYVPKKGEILDECTRTKNFIKDKLEKITNEPRKINPRSVPSKTNRQCYYHFTVATDTNNIRRVFKDVQDMILRANLDEIILL